MLFTSFLEQFVQTFVAEPFRQLADQTGWRQRASKIDPFGFIVSLVFGQLSASRQTLSSQAQTLTNAPAVKLPSAMMSYVYRLRWQVELIFRQAKSVLRLDKTESQNPCRVQAEIWARLICAVLLFSWHAHASAECWRCYQCEASFEKLIRMVQPWGHTIARAFLDSPARLLHERRILWKNLLLNARKGRQKSRPTTWENLFDLWLNSRTTPL